MTDLEVRLLTHCGSDDCKLCEKCDSIMTEAANEIDRLRAIVREVVERGEQCEGLGETQILIPREVWMRAAKARVK